MGRAFSWLRGPFLALKQALDDCSEDFAVNSSLLAPEKWDAKIFAVFKSFVYRIAADWTLSKLVRCLHLELLKKGGCEKRGPALKREYLNSILFNWPTSIERLLFPTLPDYRVATCWPR